ncbi:hypothetical protein [Brevundimonas sp. FT23042]|uniref:hypothetical protein n=1 Tax=Brevundimonas sp. FT23042 TaxID=3393749 RepID=UPI003B585D51
MLSRKLLALVGGVVAAALMTAQPAFAQTTSGDRSESDQASGRINGEQVLPGRIGGGRSDARTRAQRERGVPQRERAVPQQTAEQIMAAAQAQLTAANVACELTEATNPGVIGESQVYEAVCNNTEGYLLIASTPPQAFSCIELAGTAAIARSRDPNADVGQQCVMPGNQNGLAVIGGWARTAGVACTIDEAAAIGKSDDNNMVYEVGCANADGYWLEKTATGWDLKDCLQINAMGGNCRFTTAQEQNETLKAKLAGTDAAGCDVTQVRLMGSNANGRFFEVKCAAEGEGYVARINAAGEAQQTYTCAAAVRIGGGCTLTPVAAAPAEQ